MKRVPVALSGLLGLSLIVMLVLAAPLHAAEIQRYSFKGGNLSAGWTDGVSTTFVQVNTNTLGSPPAFLYFSHDICAETSCQGVVAFGALPDKAVRITIGGATVNVDTSSLPNFIVVDYVCDYVIGQCTETPHMPGVITLDWEKHGPVNTRTEGVYQSRSGNFMFMQNGQTSSSVALVNGSMFEFAVPSNTQGFFSTSSTVIVSVQKR